MEKVFLPFKIIYGGFRRNRSLYASIGVASILKVYNKKYFCRSIQAESG
jgi:hypothetical protein